MTEVIGTTAGSAYQYIGSVGSSATLTIQPAAGYEYLIMGVGSNNNGADTPNVNVDLATAANQSHIYLPDDATWFKKPIIITNTIYLKIKNNDAGAAQDIAVFGIVSKVP